MKALRLLCLPELCITGYGCEDAFHGPGVEETARQVLAEIVPATQGMVVGLGLPLFHRNALFNCACLAVDGRMAGIVAKRFLCGDGLHYEPRWFKPWPQGVRDTVHLDGREYPIGDLVFDCGGVKIGFEICEDAWVAGRPGGEHVAACRRYHPQPQRQPLRLRQVRGPQAAGAWKARGRSTSATSMPTCWATRPAG